MNHKEQIEDNFKKAIAVDLISEQAKKELRELLLRANQLATPEEIRKTEEEIQVEKIWWQNCPAYENLDQINRDIKSGILEKVEANNNFQLIRRLRNPDFYEWMPYLEKKTVLLVKEITQRWREKMNKELLSKDIRLSITNLLVLDNYKEEAVKRGKLAVEGSSHSKGVCVDIDGCGYYLGEAVVNPRQTPNYDDVYLPRVHQILLEILEEMKKEEALNFIQEFPDSKNQNFHIARRP